LRWVSEPDHGQAHAVNKGIAATAGEIIGWLNSDDIYLDHVLTMVGNYFQTYPEVDVLYGNAWHIDEEGAIIEAYPTEPWNLNRLKDICFISQPAAFFRRRVVDRYGSLEESLRYCMDYEYWLRLGLASAHFSHLDVFLAGSRLYPATKTLGQRSKVHIEINNMLKQRLGRVPDRWLYNLAHAYLFERGIFGPDDSRYLPAVSWQSLKAAWSWNRAISPQMLAQLSRWMLTSARTPKSSS
jgi:hypothetical protein